MSDLVERLRAWTPPFECLQGAPYKLACDAADEIERLKAALKPFADAAETLASFPDETSLDLAPITLGDLRRARAALEGKK